MTKRQIEKRLGELGLRLESAPGRFVEDSEHGNWRARWIVRPNTLGSCWANDLIPLRRLADAADVIDRTEIARRQHIQRIIR